MIGKEIESEEILTETGLLFPSPCGEMIGKVTLDVSSLERMFVFPSPCGEMIGKGFCRVTHTSPFLVSIPLRGNDRKSMIRERSSYPRAFSFPSPCGEMIGKGGKEVILNALHISFVSIPLRGNDRKRGNGTL